MRLVRKAPTVDRELDFTPMIDIVFQLMAFFLFALGFAQSEQNERIQLPDSVLAKPPDAPLDFPVTLHMTKEGTVIIAGQEVYLEGLRPYLSREAAILRSRDAPRREATIIIRADKDSPTGQVQQLIRVCQDHGFDKFSLRAKEDVGK